MICGIEIGLAIFGILALVRGRMVISKRKVVVGVPARLIGLLAMLPLPLAFGVGMLFGIAQGMNGQQFGGDAQLKLTLIEAAIVIGVAVFVFVVGAIVAVSPAEAEQWERRNRYGDDYEDDRYDDDRGPARGRYDDEYEDDRDDDRRGRRDDRRGRRDRDDDYDDDRDERERKPWKR